MPRTDESPRPSSSSTRQYARWSPPDRRSSSAMVSPRKPSSPSLPTMAGSTDSAPVPGGRVRHELAVGELGGQLADRRLLGGEGEVHDA